MRKRGKAIGMISGGLDSTLALAMVKAQGVEVKAITFYTGFCITETQRRKGGRQNGSVPPNEALVAAAQQETEVEFIDISADPAAAQRYGIRTIPTQIFFTADGTEAGRHEGFLPKEEIEKIFRQLGVR